MGLGFKLYTRNPKPDEGVEPIHPYIPQPLNRHSLHTPSRLLTPLGCSAELQADTGLHHFRSPRYQGTKPETSSAQTSFEKTNKRRFFLLKNRFSPSQNKAALPDASYLASHIIITRTGIECNGLKVKCHADVVGMLLLGRSKTSTWSASRWGCTDMEKDEVLEDPVRC